MPASHRALASLRTSLLAWLRLTKRCCGARKVSPLEWATMGVWRGRRPATVGWGVLGPPLAVCQIAEAVVSRALRWEASPAGIDPSDATGGCTLIAAAWWNPRASSRHARLVTQATISMGRTMSIGVRRLKIGRGFGRVVRLPPTKRVAGRIVLTVREHCRCGEVG